MPKAYFGRQTPVDPSVTACLAYRGHRRIFHICHSARGVVSGQILIGLAVVTYARGRTSVEMHREPSHDLFQIMPVNKRIIQLSSVVYT